MLHNPFLHSSATFKKSIVDKCGLYNSALLGAEDYELWLRVVSMGFRCVNIAKFVVCLREASNSIVRGAAWRKTRVNYAKAKVLGFARFGFHDPLSTAFCFIGPFSSFLGPKMAFNMKSLLRWFSRISLNEVAIHPDMHWISAEGKVSSKCNKKYNHHFV